ncbi:MAG: nuclear transport factor 2 family protein [Microthrixaceae bacterium]
MGDSGREVENLVYTYAERIDSGDLVGVAELFAHGRIQAAPGVVFEGAEQVRSMYEGATRLYADGTPRTRHVTTNVAVTVADDDLTAAARSYYTVFQATDELPLQAIIAGRYHDTFHRVEGEWRFDTREMFVELTGNLDHHLLFDL